MFILFDGLVDSQSNCSRASSVILNTLLKNRGAGLQDLVHYTFIEFWEINLFLLVQANVHDQYILNMDKQTDVINIISMYHPIYLNELVCCKLTIYINNLFKKKTIH